MATETLTWASIGSAGSWVASSGALLAAVQTEADGLHGIEPTGVSAMFGVPADFTADPGETVNSITIRTRMRMAGAGDSVAVANSLRLNGGSNTAHPTDPVVNTTGFVDYTWVWLTQPGGAAWTVAAANDIVRCYIDPVSGSALGGALELDVVQLVMDYGSAGDAATGAGQAITAPLIYGAGVGTSDTTESATGAGAPLAFVVTFETAPGAATEAIGGNGQPLAVALTLGPGVAGTDNGGAGAPLVLSLAYRAGAGVTGDPAVGVDIDITVSTIPARWAVSTPVGNPTTGGVLAGSPLVASGPLVRDPLVAGDLTH